MSHQCEAIVFNCMDFRFHTDIRDFLVSMGLKDRYDLVSLAGVTKGLVENDSASTELILKQIEISQRLHNIQEVYIIHHMDCGAYGGHKAFANLEEERNKQLADMEEAEKIISEKFPKLEINKVLARIKEEEGQEPEIDFKVIS